MIKKSKNSIATFTFAPLINSDDVIKTEVYDDGSINIYGEAFINVRELSFLIESLIKIKGVALDNQEYRHVARHNNDESEQDPF